MRESFLQTFRRAVTQRISVKLALVMGLVVGLLIGAAGFALTRIAQSILRDSVRSSHREIARQTAGAVALFVSRPLELLSIVTQIIGRTHLEPQAQETALVEMSLRYPMFKEILSVDVHGNEIASSNPGHSQLSWVNHPAFQAALNGREYVSPVSVGADHLPYVRIALPCWQAGRKSGVLLAQVNLRGIWDIVDKIHIGKTGISFLVSGDGLVLAHPDRRFVFRNVNIRRSPSMRSLLSGQQDNVEYRSKNGRRYLATYSPVDSMIPLGIVIQMETAEAYSLVHKMRSLTGLVFLFSILVSSAFSFFLALQLVRPIKALQRWSKKIALGDFDFYLAPKSSDEIGRLFMMFNRMSVRLKMARERERLAALGEVATSISHKLKNSIVSLKTFAQILPQRRQNEHFMERFEEKFSSTVEHLEKILMNLSLMTSSHTSHREMLDLGILLGTIKNQYEEMMEDHQIDFQLETDPELPLFAGNREQLSELFANLIQNAAQAMPEGGVLHIKAFCLQDPPLIRVTIADTGPGIPPEYVKNIFKPFFTTKHGGMGLGLSICKKIVEDHHGSLNLIHHDERGCLFQIFFPVSDPASLAEKTFSPSIKTYF